MPPPPPLPTSSPSRYFYAVRVGRTVGVYRSWAECEAQVSEFSGAKYKRFNTLDEANHFIHLYTGEYEPDNRGWGVNSVEYPANTSVKDVLLNSAKRKARGNHDQSPTTKKQFDKNDKQREALRKIAMQRLCEIPTKEKVRVYTDGASHCNGTPNARAGWGVWFEDQDLEHWNESMRLQGTLQTNNRAELMAIIRACQLCPYPDALLEIYTDSQYAIGAMKERAQGWRLSGWKMAGTSAASPGVKKGEGSSTKTTPLKGYKPRHTRNLDLLNALEKEMKGRKLTPKLYHVLAHSGDRGNEQADKLAVAGCFLPDVPSYPWIDIEICDSSSSASSEDEAEVAASPTQDIASVARAAGSQLKARLSRNTVDRSSPTPSVRAAPTSSLSAAPASSNAALFSSVDSDDTRETCSSSRAPDVSSDFDINTQCFASPEELERIERGEQSE